MPFLEYFGGSSKTYLERLRLLIHVSCCPSHFLSVDVVVSVVHEKKSLFGSTFTLSGLTPVSRGIQNVYSQLFLKLHFSFPMKNLAFFFLGFTFLRDFD